MWALLNWSGILIGLSAFIVIGVFRFAVLEPLDHIRQSILDIVSTPVGTRVMRPEYGSRAPRLVDQPVTKGWKLSVYTAVAEALHRREIGRASCRERV